MKAIIDGKRYDTEKAQQIASDRYWDGHNMERHGRNTYLYRTVNGRYFTINTTCWQGERDTLDPVTVDEAIQLWQGSLPEHDVQFETAFPDTAVEDA